MAHDDKKPDLMKAPPTAYRRRTDAITIAQRVLPILAVLGAMGFGFAEWIGQGEMRYSPGPLAAAHGQWNNQCAACHETSQPLAANNWLARASDQTHVADAKCQACHAGPPHHARQKDSEVVGCTACHRDHLGTPGRLLAVADSQCTSCHSRLADHVVMAESGSKLAYDNVSSFSLSSHPEFAQIREKRKDPGTIAFNHALHLIPGMGIEPGKAGPFVLGQLSPEDRKLYEKPGQNDKSPVVLDCRSCHQPEASDMPVPKNALDGLPVSALRPFRSAGATMAPIVFEQHCRACHPLTIDRKIPGDPKSDLLTIRHRQQPKDIMETLQGHYTNLLLNDLWKPKAAMPAGTLPGRPAESKKAAKEIDDKAAAATLKLLLEQNQKIVEQKVLGQTTCQKCHTTLDSSKGIDQTIPPGNIPAIWFEHARFDHTAHRAVDCRECHEQAFPTTGEGAAKSLGSTTSRDVLLPGIATCVKCHAPRSGLGAGAIGGARFDCIECHSYHHGDNPLQDRGSRARQPLAAPKTIADFLSGR